MHLYLYIYIYIIPFNRKQWNDNMFSMTCSKKICNNLIVPIFTVLHSKLMVTNWSRCSSHSMWYKIGMWIIMWYDIMIKVRTSCSDMFWYPYSNLVSFPTKFPLGIYPTRWRTFVTGLWSPKPSILVLLSFKGIEIYMALRLQFYTDTGYHLCLYGTMSSSCYDLYGTVYLKASYHITWFVMVLKMYPYFEYIDLNQSLNNLPSISPLFTHPTLWRPKEEQKSLTTTVLTRDHGELIPRFFLGVINQPTQWSPRGAWKINPFLTSA